MTIESLPIFTKSVRQRWASIPANIRQRLLSNVWRVTVYDRPNT